RYPYDPACAWGRIANGQGMLHRCISKDEAQSLLQQSPSELAATGTLPTAPPEPEVKEAPPRAFTLTVGPIEAEEGEMTVGALDKPVDRYRSCIEENGGLEAAQGKIIVRFLVRAERGRAEGTELDSFEGVSKKAAQCVASVVDRRRVGTPSVPL